jgi:hypothetical protein
MSTQHDRPWVCVDDAVDEYRETLEHGGERLEMLKKLKLLRAIIVNLGVVTIGLYGIFRGGDPTVLGALSLLTLVGYNGVEYSDYMALLQAYSEIQSEQ